LVIALLAACATPPSGPGEPVAPAPTSVALSPPGEHPMVVFDTDFGELNDDSQALYLLLQSRVNVLGVTTVSGNTWAAEGAAYALRQLEVEGRPDIPVYQGSDDPLFGDRSARLASETALFGVDASYPGAWARPRPAGYQDLAAPPHGGYARTAKATGNAVDFIVNSVKAHPHQVTLFVLGPATNIALAVKKNPEIVPLVKQVVYMAGAFDVPGNQGPAAEFNVWFDPEAARIAFTTPFVSQVVVPLDVTDTVNYGKAEYDRIVGGPSTPIKQEFTQQQGPKFASDPKYHTNLWDALAAAVFLRPDLVTTSSVRKVMVDTQEGPDYGRTQGFAPDHAPLGTQSVQVVQRVDIAKFFNLYTGLLSQPLAR
jgi:purine nucleosidase